MKKATRFPGGLFHCRMHLEGYRDTGCDIESTISYPDIDNRVVQHVSEAMLVAGLEEDIACSSSKGDTGSSDAANFKLVVEIVCHIQVDTTQIEFNNRGGTKIDLAIDSIGNMGSGEKVRANQVITPFVAHQQGYFDVLDAGDGFGTNRYRHIEDVKGHAFPDTEAFFSIVQLRGEGKPILQRDLRLESSGKGSPVGILGQPTFRDTIDPNLVAVDAAMGTPFDLGRQEVGNGEEGKRS